MPWKNGNPHLYTAWRDMIYRCYNTKWKQYKDYGGRGIKVCPEWRHDYKRWYADVSPTWRPGLTFDRYPDNDGDYTPTNFRWATRKEQQRNQRVTRKVTIDGEEYLAVELAEIAGIKTDYIVERAKQGLSYAEVISGKRRFNLDGFKLGAAISAKKRKARTHCKRGHELTPENITWTASGKYRWRTCRICHELCRQIRLSKK